MRRVFSFSVERDSPPPVRDKVAKGFSLFSFPPRSINHLGYSTLMTNLTQFEET